MWGKLFAVVLIVNVALWALIMAGNAVLDHRSWLGVFTAFGQLSLGCAVIASVVRDRL